MRENIKEAVREVMVRVDLFSLATFASCFLLFLILFVLGVYCFKKRFLPSFFFLLAFGVLLGTPFAIAFGSKLFFYKVEVLRQDSKPLTYSPSFLVDMTFANRGKMAFKQCMLALTLERKPQNLKNQILDFIKPLHRVEMLLDAPIKVGESFEIQTILPYGYRKSPYKLTLDCH